MSDITPQVGQIWASNDIRQSGRTIVLIDVSETKIVGKVVTNSYKVREALEDYANGMWPRESRSARKPSDRRGWTISLSPKRFQDSQRGYSLVPRLEWADVHRTASQDALRVRVLDQVVDAGLQGLIDGKTQVEEVLSAGIEEVFKEGPRPKSREIELAEALDFLHLYFPDATLRVARRAAQGLMDNFLVREQEK